MSFSRQETLDWLAARPAGKAPCGRLSPGDMVDSWLVETYLGAGRSAEVYRVAEQGTGREGALKLLTDGTHGLGQRFSDECAILKRLHLRGLPRFMAAGTHGGSPYFVLEYLLPVEFPLPRRERARFITGVARAVAELHAAGYLHRDLKPGNVMRRTDGEPVLIDLGLAKPIVSGDGLAVMPGRMVSQVDGRPVGVGTVDFAPPEQLLKGESSVRGEVFSLGKIARAMFPHRPRPPHFWRVIIRRATSESPEDRYPSAEEFALAVRRRNLPLMFTAGGAMLAAAVVAAAVLLWPNPPAAPNQDADVPELTPPTPSAPSQAASAPTFEDLLAEAENGDLNAQCKVAEAYFYGHGVPTNRAEAVNWYKQAALGGAAEAEASLGFCYAHGIACERDPAEAVEWYRLAAEKGHKGAMADLGYCLLNGLGAEPNATEAIRWITQAAAQGNAEAQTLLGECLLTGRGLPPNAESAYDWFAKAAANGHRRAIRLLSERTAERQSQP